MRYDHIIIICLWVDKCPNQPLYKLFVRTANSLFETSVCEDGENVFVVLGAWLSLCHICSRRVRSVQLAMTLCCYSRASWPEIDQHLYPRVCPPISERRVSRGTRDEFNVSVIGKTAQVRVKSGSKQRDKIWAFIRVRKENICSLCEKNKILWRASCRFICGVFGWTKCWVMCAELVFRGAERL